MSEISNDLKCMTFSKNDISRIENEAYNKALDDFIHYAYLKGIDFSFMGRIMENGESDVPVRLKKIKDDFLEQKEREAQQ